MVNTVKTLLLSVQAPIDIEEPINISYGEPCPGIDTYNLLVIPPRTIYLSLVRFYPTGDDDDDEYDEEDIDYIKALFIESPVEITEEELNNIGIGKIVDLVKKGRVIKPSKNILEIVEKVEKFLREKDCYFTKTNPSFNPVYEQYLCENRCLDVNPFKDFDKCVSICIDRRHCYFDEYSMEIVCEMKYVNGKVICTEDCFVGPSHPLRIYDKSIDIVNEKEYFVKELIYLLEIAEKLSITDEIIDKRIIEI